MKHFCLSIECQPGQKFIECLPKSQDFCISDAFRNDKIQNCVPPYASDEPDMQHHHQKQQKHQKTEHPRKQSTNGVTQNQNEYSLFYLTASIIALQLTFTFQSKLFLRNFAM